MIVIQSDNVPSHPAEHKLGKAEANLIIQCNFNIVQTIMQEISL